MGRVRLARLLPQSSATSLHAVCSFVPPTMTLVPPSLTSKPRERAMWTDGGGFIGHQKPSIPPALKGEFLDNTTAGSKQHVTF